MVKIIVVGSINMDVVNRVIDLPKPGETIQGLETHYNPGGKGANQAVAASKAGAEVMMIGAVGNDAFGPELISTLEGFGVNTKYILEKETNSGMAFITIDRTGENHIILSEGANGKLSIEDMVQVDAVWSDVSAVLLQNEISWETTEFMIQEVNKKGVRVYINPAPAVKLSDDLLAQIHTLVLNETEAEFLTGRSVETKEQAMSIVELFIDKGVRKVILTLGKNGSICMDQSKQLYQTPAFKVDVVDTTAAGDTFIGAYAVAFESGMSAQDSLTFASAAAALTVTRKGAQQSIPNQQEIQQFLNYC